MKISGSCILANCNGNWRMETTINTHWIVTEWLNILLQTESRMKPMYVSPLTFHTLTPSVLIFLPPDWWKWLVWRSDQRRTRTVPRQLYSIFKRWGSNYNHIIDEHISMRLWSMSGRRFLATEDKEEGQGGQRGQPFTTYVFRRVKCLNECWTQPMAHSSHYHCFVLFFGLPLNEHHLIPSPCTNTQVLGAVQGIIPMCSSSTIITTFTLLYNTCTLCIL